MTGTVKSKTGNVRAGPGTSFQVVATVKQGDKLNLTGRTSDSAWLQACCYKNAPAWISASLVTPSGKVSTLPVPRDIPKAPAVAAKPVAKSGAPKGVLLYSVLNKDQERWELWQYDFSTGKSQFLKEWRTEAAFSPSYKQVAYFGWPEALGGKAGICTANPDLSGEKLIFEGGVAYPSFSGDGGRIAIEADRIYIINADGNGLHPLLEGEYPAWSPKSNWIAHRACIGGACGIYLTDADTGTQRRLTTGGSDGQPAWSPNGQQLAYISQDDGNFEIYRINLDGSNKVRLTTEPASDGLPIWSPDGNWIAFRSDRGGAWAIWVMRPDGADLRKVVDAPVLPLWFWEKIAWRP
jgi:Tol biopolymer transport system component